MHATYCIPKRSSALAAIALLCAAALFGASMLSAQPLTSDYRERKILQPHTPSACAASVSVLVLRIQRGTISRESTSGDNVVARVSPAADMVVFMVGAEGCRFAGLIRRGRVETSDDVAALLRRSDAERWPEMPIALGLAPDHATCLHYWLELRLQGDTLELVLQSSDTGASPGDGPCETQLRWGQVD